MPAPTPHPVGPGGISQYRDALQRALDGSGPALAPYDESVPLPVLPDAPAPHDLVLAVGTSGSTGPPKRALLTLPALNASADATHARLGGPGQWVLAMPAHHIAGTQVILRSLRADTPLVVTDPSLREFAAVTAGLASGRAYTSLVPTQLSRLLESTPDALLRYDGILLGGAAAPPSLLARARAAGVRVLTTYGMSETAGGCVYDGAPLDGVGVELDDDGRITLAGPTIAHGYLGDPERTRAAFDLADPRRFRTDDLGEWRDGTLRALGRRDDVIVTGGLKVAPSLVEEAAVALPGVAEAVALGLPDPEWGQVVSLAITLAHPRFGHAERGEYDRFGMSKTGSVAAVRDALRDQLPPYALPRRLLVLEALPLRGPGKPDRVALAAMPGWQD